jgi:hypothetical protein
MKTFIVAILIVFPLALLGATYGRWEYQSSLYAEDFTSALEEGRQECRSEIGKVKKLKVMSAGEIKAQVFVENDKGSIYLVNLQREHEAAQWTWDIEKECQVEMLKDMEFGTVNKRYWY